MSNRQTMRSWRLGFFCSCLLLMTPGQAAADQPRVLTGHGDAVYDVAFSPAGRLMASGSYDNTVILWSLDDGSIAGKLEGHTDQVFRVAFSPDGTQLITSGRERVIRSWSVPDLDLVDERYGPEETVLAVRISPDGRYLAAGSYDGKIHLWTLTAGSPENGPKSRE